MKKSTTDIATENISFHNKSIELPNAFGSISCLRINRNKTSQDQTIGVCKNKLQHTFDPFKSHINYTHIEKKHSPLLRTRKIILYFVILAVCNCSNSI